MSGLYQILRTEVKNNKYKWIFFDNTGRLIISKNMPTSKMLSRASEYYNKENRPNPIDFHMFPVIPSYVPTAHFYEIKGRIGNFAKLINDTPQLVSDVLKKYEINYMDFVWIMTKEDISDLPSATIILNAYNQKPKHLDIYNAIVKGNTPTNSELEQIELILNSEEHVIVGEELYQLIRMPITDIEKEYT